MLFQKTTLSLIILLSLFFCSQAQVNLGFQIGESHFKIIDKITPESRDFIDEKYKPGLYVGTYAKIQLKKNWIIQPELSFMQKGFGYKGAASPNTDFKARIIYNYIEMPILFKGVVLVNVKHHFEIGIGPSIGFLFGKQKAVYRYEGEKTVLKNDYVFNLTDNMGQALGTKKYSKIDAGICFDLSFSSSLKSGFMKFGARSYIDFTNIASFSDEEKQIAGLEFKQTNLGFVFYVGYEIPLGKKKK